MRVLCMPKQDGPVLLVRVFFPHWDWGRFVNLFTRSFRAGAEVLAVAWCPFTGIERRILAKWLDWPRIRSSILVKGNHAAARTSAPARKDRMKRLTNLPQSQCGKNTLTKRTGPCARPGRPRFDQGTRWDWKQHILVWLWWWCVWSLTVFHDDFRSMITS
jgi:hypothetical protein